MSDDLCCNCGIGFDQGHECPGTLTEPPEFFPDNWKREGNCLVCGKYLCDTCFRDLRPAALCRPCTLRQRVEAAFADVRDRATVEDCHAVARRLRLIAADTGLEPPLNDLSVEELRVWLEDHTGTDGIPGPLRCWALAEADGG